MRKTRKLKQIPTLGRRKRRSRLSRWKPGTRQTAYTLNIPSGHTLQLLLISVSRDLVRKLRAWEQVDENGEILRVNCGHVTKKKGPPRGTVGDC